jgi:Ni/Co efflux regulator RcnB
MKRLLSAAMALSLLATTSAYAYPDHHDDHHGTHHGWKHGDKLPAQYRHSREVSDWRAHHLRTPPRGYHWVQVDDDYVLAGIATGAILATALAAR